MPCSNAAEAGSKLVADQFEAGSKLVADLKGAKISPIIYLASSEIARASRSATKFYYAVWFEAASKLVADRFEAGRRPPSNLSANPKPVCDQLRTSFEPASVMEFDFNGILSGAKFTLHTSFALSYIGNVTAQHSSSGRQPNFAAWYLHVTGRPSRSTLAVELSSSKLLFHD